MNDYKHFMAGISNVILRVVHIKIVREDRLNPPVSGFVKLIGAVKYEDGCYHTYYNEMKEVMKSFIIYWRETMDEAVKQADYLYHKDIDKENLVLHVVTTIHLWRDYENKFDKDFLPIESAQQQKIYDDLKQKFETHMKKLHETKAHVEAIDHPNKVVAFARKQITKALESKGKVFAYTHTYLSMLLADHLPEIRGSLKEIRNRMRNNLKQLEDEREDRLNALLGQLYENHKELRKLRLERESETELIEINSAIDKIQTQVQDCGNCNAIWKVTQDLETTQSRYTEFERIATTLTALKEELEKTCREQAIYNSRITMELPGPKYDCWEKMGKNYAERREHLQQHLLNAAKSLTTFFVVRGTTHNVMTYCSEIGRYSMDFYGHLVYHFDYGLKRTHLECTGEYRMSNDKDADYIDESGRYVLKNNQKLYQVADCTSLYKIDEDTLLKKVTTDCGHSEITKKDCAKNVKTHTVAQILPKTEAVDIKETLNAEVVDYLWGAFGAILPDVLHEVCQLRPKNPIHQLAHSLLKHKYGKPPAELRQKAAESEAYRANILKARKESAAAKTLAWKAKQVKRRKPEESDDSFNRAVYDIHVATDEFIKSLNYYN